MAWEWSDCPEDGPRLWEIDRPGGTTRHVGGVRVEHGVLFLTSARRSEHLPEWVWWQGEILGPSRWFAVRLVGE